VPEEVGTAATREAPLEVEVVVEVVVLVVLVVVVVVAVFPSDAEEEEEEEEGTPSFPFFRINIPPPILSCLSSAAHTPIIASTSSTEALEPRPHRVSNSRDSSEKRLSSIPPPAPPPGSSPPPAAAHPLEVHLLRGNTSRFNH